MGIIAVNVTAAFNRIKAHARRHKIPLDPLADRVSMTPRRAISATEKKLSYRLAASSRAEHPADPRHLVGRTLDRKRRVVRNLVVRVEPTEPPIRKVKCDLFAKPPLETHAVAVAYNQHPDHQFRVDRRTADGAIERLKLSTNICQHPRMRPTAMPRWAFGARGDVTCGPRAGVAQR